MYGEVKLVVTMSGINMEGTVARSSVLIPFEDVQDLGPIDFPSKGTDPATEALYCTHVKVRDFIMKNRMRVAHNITEKIMDVFGVNDTIMGYEYKEVEYEDKP